MRRISGRYEESIGRPTPRERSDTDESIFGKIRKSIGALALLTAPLGCNLESAEVSEDTGGGSGGGTNLISSTSTGGQETGSATNDNLTHFTSEGGTGGGSGGDNDPTGTADDITQCPTVTCDDLPALYDVLDVPCDRPLKGWELARGLYYTSDVINYLNHCFREKYWGMNDFEDVPYGEGRYILKLYQYLGVLDGINVTDWNAEICQENAEVLKAATNGVFKVVQTVLPLGGGKITPSPMPQLLAQAKICTALPLDISTLNLEYSYTGAKNPIENCYLETQYPSFSLYDIHPEQGDNDMKAELSVPLGGVDMKLYCTVPETINGVSFTIWPVFGGEGEFPKRYYDGTPTWSF